MKMFIGSVSLLLSIGVWASSGETKSFLYDGSQSSVELVLRGEKTRTEYRLETRSSVCHKTEIVGHQTVCSDDGPYTRPAPRYPSPGYPYPGQRTPVPHYPSYRHCYTAPIYSTVSYSCSKTVSIPYEEKEYDVDARVIIDVTNASNGKTSGEKINVTLNGDLLSFDVVGSKKFFIVKKKQDVRSTVNGSVKMMDGLLAIELIEAAPILEAIKMSEIKIKDSTLSFKIGKEEKTSNLGISVKIEKKKILGRNEIMFERDLTEAEYEMIGADVKVNLDMLGIDLEKGKYEITAKVFGKVDGAFLNSSQFKKALEASQSLIHKVR